MMTENEENKKPGDGFDKEPGPFVSDLKVETGRICRTIKGPSLNKES